MCGSLIGIGVLFASTVKSITTPSNPAEAKAILNPLTSLTETPSPESIKEAVNWVASNNELGEDFYHTIDGESSFIYNVPGDWSAKLQRYTAYGIGQFHKPSWAYFEKLSSMTLDYYSTRDQITLMAWAFKNGYQYHWSSWCRSYGLNLKECDWVK